MDRTSSHPPPTERQVISALRREPCAATWIGRHSLNGALPVTIASTSTGQGGAGSIAIRGKAGEPADAVRLSNTHIETGVTSDGTHPYSSADRSCGRRPGNIVITAQQVELANGTSLRADTTGGADAGAITLNVEYIEDASGA